MKTMRLTRAESIAYANGERRFWRAGRVTMSHTINHPQGHPRQLVHLCPYGQPGDLVKLSGGEVVEGVFMLIAITVDQRDGRWGWVVEVGGMTFKPEPYVLENEEGIMGTEDDLFLFLSLEAAQRHADKYPAKKWKPRLVGVLGFTGVSR